MMSESKTIYYSALSKESVETIKDIASLYSDLDGDPMTNGKIINIIIEEVREFRKRKGCYISEFLFLENEKLQQP